MLCFEAGDEIVDLTCESLEPVVVDLTHNDSVVVSLAHCRPLAAPGSEGHGHRVGLCEEAQGDTGVLGKLPGAVLLVEGNLCPDLPAATQLWGQTPRGPLSLVPYSTLTGCVTRVGG